MASLHKVKQHGREVYRVAFYDKDGQRRFIRLGELGKRAAEKVAKRVQDLADMAYAGESPDAELSGWLGKIGQDLADKLATGGLIPKRVPTEATAGIGLAEFLDGNISGRTDLKARTRNNFKQARDYLKAVSQPCLELRKSMGTEDGGP
jgi:hypothetical protein